MIIDTIKCYDGSILQRKFAYEYLRKNVVATGNIIAFRAPAEVSTHLVDLEDSLSQDFIYSDDMIHFCWEIPNVEPFGAIAFQRLFNTNIANILSGKIKAMIEVAGDDLIVHKEHTQGGVTQPKGKASVSITCVRNHAAIGHLGINVVAGKRAPAFAFSTNLSDESVSDFMHKGIELFYGISNDIFVSSTKTV